MALPLPTLAQGAAASSCTSSPDMTTLTSRDPSALSLALHPHEADGTFNLTRLLLSLLTHLTRHLLQAQGISQRLPFACPAPFPAGPDNGSERRRASGNPSLGRLALERSPRGRNELGRGLPSFFHCVGMLTSKWQPTAGNKAPAYGQNPGSTFECEFFAERQRHTLPGVPA